jgi:hypothetical protein
MHSIIETMHMILDLMYSDKRPQLRTLSRHNTLTLMQMTMNQLTSFDTKKRRMSIDRFFLTIPYGFDRYIQRYLSYLDVCFFYSEWVNGFC